MEKIQLKDYKLKKPKIHTKEQSLADEIYSYFGKKLSFGFIMNKILTKGYQFVYEAWNEIRQTNPKNRVSLFLWKIGQTKINFKKQDMAND